MLSYKLLTRLIIFTMMTSRHDIGTFRMFIPQHQHLNNDCYVKRCRFHFMGSNHIFINTSSKQNGKHFAHDMPIGFSGRNVSYMDSNFTEVCL